jgi:hypothetical protein
MEVTCRNQSAWNQSVVRCTGGGEIPGLSRYAGQQGTTQTSTPPSNHYAQGSGTCLACRCFSKPPARLSQNADRNGNKRKDLCNTEIAKTTKRKQKKSQTSQMSERVPLGTRAGPSA